jgi:hypothetical protein
MFPVQSNNINLNNGPGISNSPVSAAPQAANGSSLVTASPVQNGGCISQLLGVIFDFFTSIWEKVVGVFCAASGATIPVVTQPVASIPAESPATAVTEQTFPIVAPITITATVSTPTPIAQMPLALPQQVQNLALASMDNFIAKSKEIHPERQIPQRVRERGLSGPIETPLSKQGEYELLVLVSMDNYTDEERDLLCLPCSYKDGTIVVAHDEHSVIQNNLQDLANKILKFALIKQTSRKNAFEYYVQVHALYPDYASQGPRPVTVDPVSADDLTALKQNLMHNAAQPMIEA